MATIPVLLMTTDADQRRRPARRKDQSILMAVVRALYFSSLIVVLACDDYRMGDYPRRYDRFFNQDQRSQLLTFDRLPTEEQITIHVIAVTERHPPFTGFGRRLAKRGPAITAPLLKRLDSASNDWDKVAVIQVFSFMPQESLYDVRLNRDVMDRLLKGVATIRNDTAAEEAAELMRTLNGTEPFRRDRL